MRESQTKAICDLVHFVQIEDAMIVGDGSNVTRRSTKEHEEQSHAGFSRKTPPKPKMA